MKRRSDDESLLFDTIVKQHAIAGDDIINLALARALAHELAADSVNTSVVVNLRGLLPQPQPVAGEPDPRIRRMTDVELPVLEYLVARLDGMDEADPSARSTPWHELEQVQKDLDAMRALLSQFARDNEKLHNEIDRLRSAPVTVPDEPLPDTPPVPDNVVLLPPRPSPFAGLASALSGTDGGGMSPGVLSSGPEYSA